MPEQLPVAYWFEGEPLAGLTLPAAWRAPAQWVRGLPPALLAPASDTSRLSLRFVGVLGIGRGLLVVLPKYLRPRTAAQWAAPATSHAAETAQLLRVLRRYHQAALLAALVSTPDPETAEDYVTGEPALALALVDDFQRHGYWHQPQTELSTWAGVRPDWPRTVARMQPVFTESGPLYPVWVGHRQPATAAASLLEQVHRWAVRYCLEAYQHLLPGFAEVSYDAEAATSLAELGEPAHLLQVLDKALRTTYRDSQVQTLHLLRRLVVPSTDASADELAVSLFGTTAFHRVWEVACQAVFENRLASLPAPLPTPTWHRYDGAVFHNPLNRLIPDLVWFDQMKLLVADAKYYLVSFGSNGQVQGGPGMPDLTKQVLYQQALVPLLAAAGQAISEITNVFILPASRPAAPTETVADWQWGHAQTNLPGWEDQRVTIWLVPPACIFDAYLAGEKVAWQ